jgi:hypothetical protein
MAKEQYCDACQRLFRGEVAYLSCETSAVKLGYFVHHSNTSELSAALSLPCVICSLAWNNLDEPIRLLGVISSETVGVLLSQSNDEDGIDARRSFSIMFRLVELGQGFLSRARVDSRLIAFTPMDSMSLKTPYRAKLTRYLFTIGKSHPNDLSNNTGSLTALYFLREQYITCQTNHASCKSARGQRSEKISPIRLLEVGPNSDSLVHLRTTRDFREEMPYLCLSHCWGKNRPYTLTRSTHSVLEKGIAVSTLPRTFQDAVHVTRRLGFPYIWIDSLQVYRTKYILLCCADFSQVYPSGRSS